MKCKSFLQKVGMPQLTTLLTLKKRRPGDVWLNMKTCLDELARDPNQDPYQLLFSPNTS
jgi:hypothetical protein